MSDALYKSSDTPDFSTYPASPTDQAPGWKVYSSQDVPAENVESNRNPMFEDRARQIGTGLAKAMNTLRDTIANSKQKLSGSREELSHVTEDYQATAERYFSEAEGRVRQLKTEARLKARHYVKNYPVHLILAAGVAGVIAGAGMRLWRNDRG